MLIFLNLFFIFFKFSFTYDVIPIENFEKKIVTFNKEKDYNIYRYFIPAPPQYTTFLHIFQKIYYGYDTFKQDIYVYDNFSKIKQNSKGEFINYVTKSFFSSYSCDNGFSDSFYTNKTYYFVIKNTEKLNETMNFTLTIFSTEAIANLS